MHTEWVPEIFISSTRMGKSRLQRFFKRDPPLDPEDPFDENFVLVERIVDISEINGVEYLLVKWCNLPYCECTWEKSTDINDDHQKKEFEKRKEVGEKRKEIIPKSKRPKPEKFQEISEGDIKFKDDLQLRGYQLEGLNWLLYCWYNKTNNILGGKKEKF